MLLTGGSFITLHHVPLAVSRALQDETDAVNLLEVYLGLAASPATAQLCQPDRESVSLKPAHRSQTRDPNACQPEPLAACRFLILLRKILDLNWFRFKNK